MGLAVSSLHFTLSSSYIQQDFTLKRVFYTSMGKSKNVVLECNSFLLFFFWVSLECKSCVAKKKKSIGLTNMVTVPRLSGGLSTQPIRISKLNEPFPETDTT